jgi:hypothetical protein
MAGDCFSSFVKRRFGLEPSSMTLGLDQVLNRCFLRSLAGLLAASSSRRGLDRSWVLREELAMSRLFFACAGHVCIVPPFPVNETG